MKHSLYLSLVIMAIVFASCGSKAGQERMQAQLDSLQQVNQKMQDDNQLMSSFVQTFSDGLDSIFVQENLLRTGVDETGNVLTKDQIRDKVRSIAEYINDQKTKISELENQLDDSSQKNAKLLTVVKFLKQQLSEKEGEIMKLQKELDTAKGTIHELDEKNQELTVLNSGLKEEVTEQNEIIRGKDEALQEKEDIINEGYVFIGTKKELKASGVLSGGGFLSKAKVDLKNIDTSKAKKVDIRQFKEITISSKNPKILSHMPESSYRLEKNDNGTTKLIITSPSSFWSVSSVLIIQE